MMDLLTFIKNKEKIIFLKFYEDFDLFIIFFIVFSLFIFFFFFIFYYKYRNLNLSIIMLYIFIFFIFFNILILKNIYNNNYILNFFYFNNTFEYNGITCILDYILFINIFIFLIYNLYYYKEKENNNTNIFTIENVFILMFVIIGFFLTIHSSDIISTYLSIEIQSFCLYTMAVIAKKNNFPVSGGLKFFIIGSLSSCILLFGCSFIYGFTGITKYSEFNTYISFKDFFFFESDINIGLILGVFFLFIGLFFKLGIVPFHFWMIWVMESIPFSYLGFFAILPKIAILGLLLKILYFSFIKIIFYVELLNIISILSILTIFVGSLGGLIQVKIKKLLAYSSINNMGFMISLIVFFKYLTLNIIFFYLIIYVFISLIVFGIFMILNNYINNLLVEKIGDLQNLFFNNPIISLLLQLCFFSFLGLPPLAGFFSKFYILNWLILNKFFFLSFIIILLSVISSFYYIRLIKIMFFFENNKIKFFKFNKSKFIIYFILFIFSLFNFFIYFMLDIINVTIDFFLNNINIFKEEKIKEDTYILTKHFFIISTNYGNNIKFLYFKDYFNFCEDFFECYINYKNFFLKKNLLFLENNYNHSLCMYNFNYEDMLSRFCTRKESEYPCYSCSS